jgi:thiol-disulfide isomerase/thioredoxin
MASWRGRPLLLNFWATWCGPCVVEMPLLDRFAREQPARGWQVLALAVDQPDPVRRFIAERTLTLPVAIAGAVGLDLSRHLGNVGGGLPFTAAFDSTGAAVQRRLGTVSSDLLAGWKASIR